MSASAASVTRPLTRVPFVKVMTQRQARADLGVTPTRAGPGTGRSAFPPDDGGSRRSRAAAGRREYSERRRRLVRSASDRGRRCGPARGPRALRSARPARRRHRRARTTRAPRPAGARGPPPALPRGTPRACTRDRGLRRGPIRRGPARGSSGTGRSGHDRPERVRARTSSARTSARGRSSGGSPSRGCSASPTARRRCEARSASIARPATTQATDHATLNRGCGLIFAGAVTTRACGRGAGERPASGHRRQRPLVALFFVFIACPCRPCGARPFTAAACRLAGANPSCAADRQNVARREPTRHGHTGRRRSGGSLKPPVTGRRGRSGRRGSRRPASLSSRDGSGRRSRARRRRQAVARTSVPTRSSSGDVIAAP